MKGVTVAILGATGAVGQEMLKVLAERSFPVAELRLLGDRQAGKCLVWRGNEYTVEKTSADAFEGVDLTLVAAGSEVSLRYAPEAVKRGAIVIDNSSAYRLHPDVPLVVPEVNPEDVGHHHGIIANPNCSTIIAMVAIKPLHDHASVKRMVVSTYQAVSGAGQMGLVELETQTRQLLNGESISPTVFPYQIAYNLIPHIDDFASNGYSKEELKMLHEGRKILHAPDLRVSCTCVRVPVLRSHSEAITIGTDRPLPVELARELLGKAPGVRVVDDPSKRQYPMPIDSSDQDLVHVGRIREDLSCHNGLVLWVCGDQIRKGAATNAVQIAELLVNKGLI